MPVNDLTWEIIEDFCSQRIPENAYLEYKENFPKNLEKSISSMANTHGGIILIGIEEDDENRPKIPIKGIEFQRGLSERVTNIILTNITPTLLPDIAVCKSEDSARAIVVIRISQSKDAPHAVMNNKKVYLRTGNINKPESLASLDDIQWLLNGRNISKKLNKRLINDSIVRFNKIHSNNLAEFKAQKQDCQNIVKGILSISVCPLYPKEHFLSPPDIQKAIKEIQVDDLYRGSGNMFPILDNIHGIMFQNGIIFKEYSNQHFFHTELNSYGHFFYWQSLIHDLDHSGRRQKAIRSDELLFTVDLCLRAALSFFRKIGFWGEVKYGLKIEKSESTVLDLESSGYLVFEENIALDNVIDMAYLGNVNEIEDKRKDIIIKSMQNIGWAYDYNFNTEFLDEIFYKVTGDQLLIK